MYIGTNINVNRQRAIVKFVQLSKICGAIFKEKQVCSVILYDCMNGHNACTVYLFPADDQPLVEFLLKNNLGK